MGITREKAHQELDLHTILRGAIGLGDLPDCLFWPGTSPEATRVYCYLIRCAREGFWPTPMNIVSQCLRSGHGRKRMNNGALISLLEAVMEELARLGIAYWNNEQAVWADGEVAV